jgi:hypothetical protein
VIGNNNSLASGRPTRSAIQAIIPGSGVPRSGTLTQRSASERLGLKFPKSFCDSVFCPQMAPVKKCG